MLQIFVCRRSHIQHLTTALDCSQITFSSTVLSNCNCSQSIITCIILLPLYCILLVTWPQNYTVTTHNTVPYPYIPPSLHILYIELQNLKYINCVINCNFVPNLYFSHIMLLIVLYIDLQTLKYIISVFSNIVLSLIHIFFSLC